MQERNNKSVLNKDKILLKCKYESKLKSETIKIFTKNIFHYINNKGGNVNLF